MSLLLSGSIWKNKIAAGPALVTSAKSFAVRGRRRLRLPLSGTINFLERANSDALQREPIKPRETIAFSFDWSITSDMYKQRCTKR